LRGILARLGGKTMLEVRLLGQFGLRRDDAAVLLPSRPAQSLLAYLVLSAGAAHRREKLAGLFWPDADEDNARSNLRHALFKLRQALGEEEDRPGEAGDDVVRRHNVTRVRRFRLDGRQTAVRGCRDTGGRERDHGIRGDQRGKSSMMSRKDLDRRKGTKLGLARQMPAQQPKDENRADRDGNPVGHAS